MTPHTTMNLVEKGTNRIKELRQLMATSHSHSEAKIVLIQSLSQSDLRLVYITTPKSLLS
jgi:hypothetical protein